MYYILHRPYRLCCMLYVAVYDVLFYHSPPRCQIGGNDDVRGDRLTFLSRCLGTDPRPTSQQ